MRTAIPALGLLASGLLCGCGASPNPCVYGTSIGILSDNNIVPITGIADHRAAPPGNQFQFHAVGSAYVVSGEHCPVPAVVGPVYLDWTSTDPKDISFDSSATAANGTATCLNATTEGIPVTGTPVPGTGTYRPATVTAIMSCK